MGYWKNDKFHGKGELKLIDENAKYIGEWKDGQMHGKGVYFFADGSVYDGNYQEDQRHG